MHCKMQIITISFKDTLATFGFFYCSDRYAIKIVNLSLWKRAKNTNENVKMKNNKHVRL